LHGLGSVKVKVLLDQGVGLDFELQAMISVEQAEAIPELGVFGSGTCAASRISSIKRDRLNIAGVELKPALALESAAAQSPALPLAVILVGTVVRWSHHLSTPIAIAVLPLENINHDSGGDYFAGAARGNRDVPLCVVNRSNNRPRPADFLTSPCR
jgi:hypothetical protein